MADGVRQRRRVDVQGRQATIVTRRTVYGQPQEEIETVEVPVFATEVAMVSIEGGITRHVGDHNFIKVSVSLSLPCLPIESEWDRAYQIGSDFVRAKLERELGNAMAEEPLADGSNSNAQENEDQATAAGIRRRVEV